MGPNLREVGKFIGWIACILGGLAGFLQWLGIKPKDLAVSQSIPLPHVFWLLTAITLFVVGIGSAVWSGIVQRREINRLRAGAQWPTKAQWKQKFVAENAERIKVEAELKAKTLFPKVRFVKESIDNRGNVTLTLKNLGNSTAFNVIVRDWVEAGHYIRASAPAGNGPPGWTAKLSTKDSLRGFTSRALGPGEEFTYIWSEDTEEKHKISEEYSGCIIQSRGNVTYTNSTGASGFSSNFCYVPKVTSQGWTIPKCECIGGNEEGEP